MNINVPTRGEGWIQTFTGRKFWPLDPHPDDIDIVDIAHALSLKCRYGGHSTRFISVGEHSIVLAEHAPTHLKKWAMLHDAPEAYSPFGDVPRPVKRHVPFAPELERIEERLMEVIAERFDLEWPMPPEIKDLDNRIILDEKAVFMSSSPAAWTEDRSGLKPLGARLLGVSPLMAKDWFLDVWGEL